MRKLFLSLFIISPMAVTFTACGPSAAEERLGKVDSLETVLKGISQKLATIDTSIVKEYYANSRQSLIYVQTNNTDTLNKELAFFMSDYHALNKSFALLVEQREGQGRELDMAYKQLDDLRLDIQSGLVEQNQFVDYLGSEASAIQRTSETVDNMYHWYTSSVEKYESMNPKVEEIVQKIKAEGSASQVE